VAVGLVGVWLGVEYLVEPEAPDTSENALLYLDEIAAGITGAVGGSSTWVLGRFWKKPQPEAGLSGAGLAGSGERFLQIFGFEPSSRANLENISLTAQVRNQMG
jgi:hypothetical protein